MSDPIHYLSVCAIYRNEGPYMREWVAFHRLMGVERFYLYNDGSEEDGHREALAPYVDEGLITLYEWPDCLPPNVSVGDAFQCAAYEHCLHHHRQDSRWIAFIDIDEFLFSPTGRSLPDMLSEYEQWPGVGVNWAYFGTSGHRTRPDGLVIENYVRRTDQFGWNRPIKSVVDPRRVRNFCLPHFFFFHGEPRLAVDENHRPIDRRPGGNSFFSMTDEVSFSKLRLNHYATKSEEELRRKWTLDNDLTTGVQRNFSEARIERGMKVLDEIDDRTIQMHLPALREELARVEGRAVAST
jgi:hypothetical protein